MNKIIHLLFLITVLGACLPIKNQVKKRIMKPEPFKGVNILLIENELTVNQNMYLVEQEFLKRGYKTIVNRKNFIVSTADSLIEKGTAVYLFNALVSDKTIDLSGKFNLKVVASVLGDTEQVNKYDIEYLGSEKAISKKLFAELRGIAKNIEGKITYVNDKSRRKGSVL